MELVYWSGSPIDLPFVWRLPGKGNFPCIHSYHSPIAPVSTGWFTRLLREVHPPCGQPLEQERRSAHTPACGSVVSSLEAQPKGHLCRSTVRIRYKGFKCQETGSRGSWGGRITDFALWGLLEAVQREGRIHRIWSIWRICCNWKTSKFSRAVYSTCAQFAASVIF